LSERQFTVIAVLPRDFRWGASDVFTPLAPDRSNQRGDHRLSVIGRLKPGVSLAQANAEMVTIARQLEQQYPATNGAWTVRLASFYDWLIPEEIRSTLAVILGAVSFVLLIACANVANLLLARAAARRREIAVRVALGARGARLVRQLLTESVLLALCGGALGLMIAVWAVDLIRSASAAGLPRISEIRVDQQVLFFTLGVSVLTGLIFGLAPALQAARTDLNETLKEGGRGAAGQARQRTRSLLVVAEVSLSMVLLVGAGLLLRSFAELLQVQPGFATANLLSASLNLPGTRYNDTPKSAAFQTQLLERLAAVPGIRSAAISTDIPMSGGGTSMEVYFDDRPPAPDGQQASAQWRAVSPGYFETMGIPLLRGRDLGPQDVNSEPNQNFTGVVISDEMARRYWPNEDPVGRQFRPWARANKPLTVVGVVGSVRMFSLESDPAPVVYINSTVGLNSMFVLVRTEGPAGQMAGVLRETVKAIDPNLAVASVRSMEEMLDGTLAPRRFQMTLLAGFAGVALVMAAVGLFGVMAYLVAQRTHEIGLRMALGAGRSDILRMVLRQGMLLTGIGIAAGATGAAALTHLMANMLFGVAPLDPIAFLATALVLALAAGAACLIPARRAMRIDPLTALRYE